MPSVVAALTSSRVQTKHCKINLKCIFNKVIWINTVIVCGGRASNHSFVAWQIMTKGILRDKIAK
jgi:hypothetical protein